MRIVLQWLVITAVFYPLYLGSALLIDAFIGQQWFMAALQYDSKSMLLRTLLMDGVKALPWSALAGVLLVSGMVARPAAAFSMVVAVGIVSGVVVALWLSPWVGAAVLAAAVASGLLAMGAGKCV